MNPGEIGHIVHKAGTDLIDIEARPALVRAFSRINQNYRNALCGNLCPIFKDKNVALI
jgi:hypothetical protein